jgi:hypothetical protein
VGRGDRKQADPDAADAADGLDSLRQKGIENITILDGVRRKKQKPATAQPSG